MVPEGAATASPARERIAAAVRCLVLFTVFVMMRLPGAVERSEALDWWLASGAVYVLLTTFGPLGRAGAKRLSLAVISLDVLFITGLLYLTGGMRSEYYLLYYLPVLHASVRLNFRDGIGASILTAVSYVFMGIAHPQAEIEIHPVWRMGAFGTSTLLLGILFSLAARESSRLRNARDHYRQVSEARSDLMAVMAHEFRNPMTSIAGFSQLLAANPLDPERQREYAGIIHEQCLRLNRLVSGLLELSRLEAGKMEPQLTRVPLRRLLSAAADVFRAGDAADIVVSAHPENLEAKADPDMVLQVLHNLLSNAAKYAGARPRISVAAGYADRQQPGMVQIDVKDNGPGIPADELPRVFDRFYRCPSAKAQRADGTGLGLAICKAIIQAHGGAIWAASEPGRGATVSFTLPAAEQPAETEAEAARAPSDSRQESLAPAGCP